MELSVKNTDELSAWMHQRKALGHDMRAIKGPAPGGATYGDGTPIVRPVNVQWIDVVTGETFDVDYSKEKI